MLVEVIRNVAEYAVFGEKLKKQHLETLIERNLFGFFVEILNKNNRFVNLQLIQTTSIMLANIKSAQNRYYILSHPFLNALIQFKHNFFDEEIVDTLVSFLKGLALLIDSDTVKLIARRNSFPLLQVTVKLLNHSETMVRNASRIILLTLLKLNDPVVNQLISDVPFAPQIFCHIGCQLRDTILQLDFTHSTTQQSNPIQSKSQQPSQSQRSLVTTTKAQKKQIDYTKMADACDDLQDLIEFISEIFQQCSNNKTVTSLLVNSLLHYCYFPVVIPSLVGSHQKKNQIGISTGLFVATMTFKHLKSAVTQCAIVSVLTGNRIPQIFRKSLKNEPVDPQVTYSYRWRHRLTHTPVTFLQEFMSTDGLESNLFEYELDFCKELQKNLKDQDVLTATQKLLQTDDLVQVEQYHFQISKALGLPVGLCKIYSQIHKEKYQFESLYNKCLSHQILNLQDKVQEDLIQNDYKRQFLQFLMAKDDNLLLQTNGLILTILSQSKISCPVLYHHNLFPVGGQTIKSLLLQRLLGNEEKISKLNESDEKILERLEGNFQKVLFQNLQKTNPTYDTFVVQWLLKALIPEPIAFEEQYPNFRTLTLKICCTLLMLLTFNKNCAPVCLLDQEHEILKEAYGVSIKNLLHLLSQQQTAYAVVAQIKQQFTTFKPQLTFDQLEHLILNPKIQVVTCETLPNQLKQEPNFYSGHVHTFLILRFLKAHLLNYNQDTNQELKNDWQKERAVDQWQIGHLVQIQSSCEFILCSTKVQQKMITVCVLVDQDYFLLVEMVSDTTMKIHEKKDLKSLTCTIDLQEPRNLTVCDLTVLYFDSANKCTYVKNLLDQNRQLLGKRNVFEFRKYLEKLSV